ncbi:MAG: glycerol-3-phosphate 1-O-acyltransferase PlsY [Coriobacteriales bacterium]|nr:glycerol-3-phosphate 1-O-acyltransferase PlsY [Coriobacteriales bacterium]
MALPETPAVWIAFIVCCLLAYFICGISSAHIIGRYFAHVDVRKVGSGNLGSTNMVRAAGTKYGVITLLCDIAKAALAVGLGYLIIGWATGSGIEQITPGKPLDWLMACVYLCAVLGHIFSPYLHFKGGKGIAVGFGGAVVLAPWAGLALWIPFLIFAFISKTISLGSIMAALSLPFLMLFIYHPTLGFMIAVSLVAFVVIFSHRQNIVRLLKGEEKPFSFKKIATQDNTSKKRSTDT